MTILVTGASGATGRLLVQQLLLKGLHVKVVVRNPENLPPYKTNNSPLEVIQASILDLTDEEMVTLVKGCDAVVSCLGHNLTFKGLYGSPRRLVTDAVRRLCNAIKKNHAEEPTKFILMNTTGNRNRDLHEPISLGQRSVIGLLRLLLPPHVDNEQAAEYLRTQIGQNNSFIEWVAVRPDGLIDEEQVSEYEVHPSPTRSAIFNAGKTSRINVGHFMAELISNKDLWQKWKGKMPVVYNREAS